MVASTLTLTETFTVTHARHMAAKVAADLMRFRDFYGQPTLERIDAYEREVVALMKGDYLDYVIYGFKRDGKIVEGIKYRASAGGVLVADDDPGKLRPKPEIVQLPFASFLAYNERWWALGAGGREKIEADVGFQRSTGEEPGVEGGYWLDDRTYSAGGRSLGRSSLRRW
jgi:HORMA domain-containing protein